MSAAAPRVDPKLLGYGDTFGTYAGRNLGDTDIYSTAIDSDKLNKSTFDEGIGTQSIRTNNQGLHPWPTGAPSSKSRAYRLSDQIQP